MHVWKFCMWLHYLIYLICTNKSNSLKFQFIVLYLFPWLCYKNWWSKHKKQTLNPLLNHSVKQCPKRGAHKGIQILLPRCAESKQKMKYTLGLMYILQRGMWVSGQKQTFTDIVNVFLICLRNIWIYSLFDSLVSIDCFSVLSPCSVF